jgi:peptidoglycan/xylan/chitin deacetylase (PgdA/CDA1 family)
VWVGLVVILVVFVYYGIPFIYMKYTRRAMMSKVSESGYLVLTFDDGPSENLSMAVLDLLDTYDVKATFFPLGRDIAGRENTVRQVAQRGHEIGSHGFDHLNYLKVSPWRAIKDIKKGWDVIDAALGINKRIYPFRPPYGKLNIFTLVYLLLKKVPVIYWTYDSGDSWNPRPDSGRTAKLIENSPGAVILHHDFEHWDRETELWILESVRLTLEKAKEKNMNIVTVSKLV